MTRHLPSLAAVLGLALWAGVATAAPPPEPDPEPAADTPAAPATWALVRMRNAAADRHGLAAVAFGVASERGRSRPATLRVDCLDGATRVHLDADGLRPGPWAVAVRYSLDGERFVADSWPARADGSGLTLAGERAIAFVAELHGRRELRLAVGRPLSVPFLLQFAVDGTEPALRPLAERCRWTTGPAVSDAGR
jgi:type VI secretion system VasI family protein